MKELARDAGLPVPEFAAVDGPLDLLDFVDAHGLPVVVKPRFGAGADGVSILREPEEVACFLSAQENADPPYLPGQWMAETFVHGDFCHVDGIMRNGRIVHSWPSQYNGGVHEHVRDQSCLSSVLLAADDPRHAVLTQLTADLIAALPFAPEPLAFHLEAWIGADGKPVLCEIASRAGGALVAETYEQAFGVQLAKEGLRAQCGSALTLTEQPPAPESAWGWVLIPPGHGALVPPREPCPVPGAQFTVYLAEGAVGAGLGHATESVAGAIVSASTPAEVRKRLDEAVDWWRMNSSWT
jgi:biotin carboxylase